MAYLSSVYRSDNRISKQSNVIAQPSTLCKERTTKEKPKKTFGLQSMSKK